MNIIRKHELKNKAAVFLLLLTCLISMTGISVNAAASTSVWLPVKQKFETANVEMPDEAQTFEYRLVPLEEGNPMPEGSKDGVYSLMITGNNGKKIQIDYHSKGVYSYHLEQVVEEEKAGYTYDREQYTITVCVKYSNRGILISETSVAKESNGMKTGILEFTNAFGVSAAGTGQNYAAAAGNTADAVNQPVNGEAAVEEGTPDAQDLERLGSEGVPKGLRNTDAWALANLILAVLTVVDSVVLLIVYFNKKKKMQENQNEEERRDTPAINLYGPLRILGAILSIVSVVFFFLTEDIRLPMRMTDQYTWMMAALLAVQLVDMIYIGIKGKLEKAQEQN